MAIIKICIQSGRSFYKTVSFYLKNKLCKELNSSKKKLKDLKVTNIWPKSKLVKDKTCILAFLLLL